MEFWEVGLGPEAGEVRWCGASAPARRKGMRCGSRSGVRQKTARGGCACARPPRKWAKFGPLAISMQVEPKRRFGSILPTS